MRMKWGVLYRNLPFYDGGRRGVRSYLKKIGSSGGSFQAFLFNRSKQLRPKRVPTAGYSLLAHG